MTSTAITTKSALAIQAVRPIPPNTIARIGVAQQIAARTAAMPPVAMSERSFTG
jgi:hypothetical protein